MPGQSPNPYVASGRIPKQKMKVHPLKEDNPYDTHFVFSRQEYDTLCKKAKQCGLSRSVYLRLLILEKPIKARPSEDIQELYVEINRMRDR